MFEEEIQSVLGDLMDDMSTCNLFVFSNQPCCEQSPEVCVKPISYLRRANISEKVMVFVFASMSDFISMAYADNDSYRALLLREVYEMILRHISICFPCSNIAQSLEVHTYAVVSQGRVL